jgi:hypothetical protein
LILRNKIENLVIVNAIATKLAPLQISPHQHQSQFFPLIVIAIVFAMEEVTCAKKLHPSHQS